MKELDLPLSQQKTAGFSNISSFPGKTNWSVKHADGAEVLYQPYTMLISYMPSTGRFYNQPTADRQLSICNVFLNLKLKRTRIFLMSIHVTPGSWDIDYYMVPTYPMNVRDVQVRAGRTFYN